MKVNSEINEINFLDEIDGLEEEYIKKFGVKPLNVSNWNSSYEFKSDLVELIEINVPFNQLDYKILFLIISFIFKISII